MAKIGYLFLNNGRWGDQQIVPADWVSESTQSHVGNPWNIPAIGYGYLWWSYDTSAGHFFEAQGAFFQRIDVSVEKNMVVAITATDNNLNNGNISVPSFMRAILRTVQSDAPLPANSQGAAHLQTAIEAVAQPAAQPVPELPALATQLTGETFHLETSDLLLYEADVNSLPAEDWQIATLGLDFGQDTATLRLQTMSGIDINVPVGLDGVYRTTPSPLGTLAARGEWLNDNRFRFDLRRLEQGLVLRYVLIFADDGFTGSVVSQRPGDWNFLVPTGGRFSGQMVNSS
jgi:hypothetical protein